MRARSLIAIALAVPALVAAGCGDDDEDGDQAATTPTAAPTTQTTAPTATTPAEGRRPVSVVGTEFRFTPSSIRVRAGETTFRLRNEGAAPHALEVEGQGIEEETRVIQGGQTAELTVDLEPGEYVIYCPVGNHRQMGMEGTLNVS